jgi:hypothetical protein
MPPGDPSPAGEKSAVMIIRAAGRKEINSRLYCKFLVQEPLRALIKTPGPGK